MSGVIHQDTVSIINLLNEAFNKIGSQEPLNFMLYTLLGKMRVPVLFT
jgi:hypothetical protein